MTTLACLAAFFGASMCWGVIGACLAYRIGYNSGRREALRPAFMALMEGIHIPCALLTERDRADLDAALDAEIEGSK